MRTTAPKKAKVAWTTGAIDELQKDFEGYKHSGMRDQLLFKKYGIGRHWARKILKTRHLRGIREPITQKKVGIGERLRWQIWQIDNFTCVYCGDRQFLSVDHLFPESKGGKTVIENLYTACMTCNSRKRARTNFLFPKSSLLTQHRLMIIRAAGIGISLI